MASVFSGKSGRNSAIWTAQQAQQQLGELKDIYGQGRQEADTAITGAFQPSMDFLNQYYGQQRADLVGGGYQSRLDYAGARDSSIGSLQQGYGRALGDLGQYYGQGAEALNKGVAAYQPLVDQGMRGYDMYSNSLGLGGAAGTKAAQDAFTAGPGYQWNVDQATSQAARAANKLGMTYSGNTVDAQTRLASNLANQEYGNWQKMLSGYQGAAQNAVAGQAGQLSNLAQLYQGQAGATSALQAQQGRDIGQAYMTTGGLLGGEAQQTGSALAGAAGQQGANLAQLQTNYGQSMASNALGYMGNLAGANQNYYSTVIPAGQQGMMAGQQAAQNRMGAIMGGVQMAGQALGGIMGMPMAGGGSVGGSLIGKLFG